MTLKVVNVCLPQFVSYVQIDRLSSRNLTNFVKSSIAIRVFETLAHS